MINNGVNYLRSESPEYYEAPQTETVPFELEDFYGSNEDTLHVIVRVFVNQHYNNGEILAAYIVEAGIRRDVLPFLTEDQKHDVRLLAKQELD